MMEKGYVHIYTGNGKGKTTAAFGLAVRAACSGKNVFIGQFVKSMKYNETKIEKLFDGSNGFGKIEIHQYGSGCFIDRNPAELDVKLAEEGLAACAKELTSGKWDVVILDELTIALYFNLLQRKAVETVINSKAENTEVAITGRYAPDWLIEKADLVTDMQEIKHYYTQGILSRDGIDR